VTLLHAENHRPDPSKLKPRMSRHWSDVAVMSVSHRFVTEKLSLDLLRTVIRFKQIYFAANWAKYENAVPGTIRIAPNEQLRKVLRDDYAQMKEMLPVDALTFDQILEKLDALEIRLNALYAIAR
jgi:Nucleotidyl transferase AbiEii toxin, Type IV TA system